MTKFKTHCLLYERTLKIKPRTLEVQAELDRLARLIRTEQGAIAVHAVAQAYRNWNPAQRPA
jgi:predicted transcriptional regulator